MRKIEKRKGGGGGAGKGGGFGKSGNDGGEGNAEEMVENMEEIEKVEVDGVPNCGKTTMQAVETEIEQEDMEFVETKVE